MILLRSKTNLLVLREGVASDELHDLGQAVLLLQDVTATGAELAVVGVVAVEERLEHTHVPVPHRARDRTIHPSEARHKHTREGERGPRDKKKYGYLGPLWAE